VSEGGKNRGHINWCREGAPRAGIETSKPAHGGGFLKQGPENVTSVESCKIRKGSEIIGEQAELWEGVAGTRVSCCNRDGVEWAHKIEFKGVAGVKQEGASEEQGIDPWCCSPEIASLKIRQ